MSIGIIAKRGNSGPAKCPTCGGKGRVNLRQWGSKRGSGPPCTDCNGTGIDYGTHPGAGEIDDPNQETLWFAEPMDLSFRFLKGQGQQIRGGRINEAMANLAGDSGILDDAGADEEDQVEEEQPEEELSELDRLNALIARAEKERDRFSNKIEGDPELRHRKLRQPAHALAGGGYKGFNAGPYHPHKQGRLED